MESLEIRDVRTILTAPDGINLVVVKIETSKPELYGLGCATFTQKHLAVKTAVNEYLRPFLIGKDPRRIEDIWQSAFVSGYWRNGPILNNALSGVDQALWDIKGKLAGMPVYELLGGKCREAVPVYRHADDRDEQEVEHNVRSFMEEGYRYIRCQMGLYGGNGNTDSSLNNLNLQKVNIVTKPSPENGQPGAYFDPDAYARSIPRLFEHLRNELGFNVELLHDIHERVSPIEAIRIAKQLEPYRLFFLEDPFVPENIEWLKIMRHQSATPISMGELFTHPLEWKPLIVNNLIDFIRCHVSNIGGITPV
jgi:mannonate dehydratase